jgi:hypothetical protein
MFFLSLPCSVSLAEKSKCETIAVDIITSSYDSVGFEDYLDTNAMREHIKSLTTKKQFKDKSFVSEKMKQLIFEARSLVISRFFSLKGIWTECLSGECNIFLDSIGEWGNSIVVKMKVQKIESSWILRELSVLNDPVQISFEKFEYDFKNTVLQQCLRKLVQVYGGNHLSVEFIEGYDACYETMKNEQVADD